MKRSGRRNFFLGMVLLALIGFFQTKTAVWANSSMYQRCRVGNDCIIGDYVFDNNGDPITDSACVITIRNPSGTIVVGDASMSVNSDGWHYYTVNISSPTGLYRGLMSCSYNSENGYINKSFVVGSDFEDIDENVWDNTERTLTSFGSLVADIWGYATRTLTSFGSIATKTNVDEATQSAVSSIKGSPAKDLSDLSSEIASVQTTTDSIEAKVDSLTTTVNAIDTKTDSLLTNWGDYSASEMIAYIDGVESRIGTSSDTCNEETLFGYSQCLQDKWGEKTALQVYNLVATVSDTADNVRTELGHAGKSTTAYENLQTLQNDLDSLQALTGASDDASTANTIFGRIKEIKEDLAKLDTIDTNIDSLITNWDIYDADDIYDKVKNLSSDISDINTVNNVSSILSLGQTDADETEIIKNKVLAMKAVIDTNRLLLEKTTNSPIIKTWLEKGSIIFKFLLVNPSKITPQTAALKYYLPKEVKKENIIKIDEGVEIKYDPEKEAFYATGQFKLQPNQTKTLSVEVTDVWQIDTNEIKIIKKQAEDLAKGLEHTAYFSQASSLKNDILVDLEKVLSRQQRTYTPEAKINKYRESIIEIQGAKNKIEDLKKLAGSADSTGTLSGFIGGIQTTATWGIIIIIIAGFAFLAYYIRILIKKEDETESDPKNTLIDKNKSLLLASKKTRFIIIVIVSTVIAIALFTLFAQKTFFSGKAKTSPPTGEKTIISTTPSNTITPTPKVTKIQINIEGGGTLNIRQEATINSKKIGQVENGQELEEVKRSKDDQNNEWVMIKADNLPEGKGWLMAKFTKKIPDKEEIKIKTEKQVLGKTDETQLNHTDNHQATLVIPQNSGGIEIYQNPSVSSQASLINISQKVQIVDKRDNWIKIRGSSFSGWVFEELIQIEK